MAGRRTKITPNRFVALLDQVKPEVDRRLLLTCEESTAYGRTLGPEVEAMINAVSSLCERGGKRLRPGLCVAGALSARPSFDWSALLEAGVALELLQAYFLIHDDWMDDDDLRRGGPTAHVSLGRHFRSKALGARSAILAGDHAVSLAQRCLALLNVSPARLKKAMKTFADMQLAAVAGQQLDIIARTNHPELTYELKTASYTVTGPLQLGANLVGGSQALLAALADYGKPTGIAFQLADDLLGVFGDPSKTGKPRGADLTAGKNTPLVRHGLRLLAPAERQRLRTVLKSRKARPSELQTLVRRLDECGARAEVVARMNELRLDGLSAARAPAIKEPGRQLLEDAARALTDRDV